MATCDYLATPSSNYSTDYELPVEHVSSHSPACADTLLLYFTTKYTRTVWIEKKTTIRTPKRATTTTNSWREFRRYGGRQLPMIQYLP